MAANTALVIPKQARTSFVGPMTVANITKNGATGTMYLLCTAAPDNSLMQRILLRALGANVASLCRVFLNNGQDPTVATNNTLIGEIQTTITTLSENTAQIPFEMSFPPLPLLGNAGVTPERVYLAMATGVIAGFQAIAVLEDF